MSANFLPWMSDLDLLHLRARFRSCLSQANFILCRYSIWPQLLHCPWISWLKTLFLRFSSHWKLCRVMWSERNAREHIPSHRIISCPIQNTLYIAILGYAVFLRGMIQLVCAHQIQRVLSLMQAMLMHLAATRFKWYVEEAVRSNVIPRELSNRLD
jgi:hypothetical protein